MLTGNHTTMDGLSYLSHVKNRINLIIPHHYHCISRFVSRFLWCASRAKDKYRGGKLIGGRAKFNM